MRCTHHRWYVTGSRATMPNTKETAFGLSTLKIKDGQVSEVHAIRYAPLIYLLPISRRWLCILQYVRTNNNCFDGMQCAP